MFFPLSDDYFPRILDFVSPCVCQVESAYPGTGFLVTPWLLITSQRILPTIERARQAWARFTSPKEETITIRLNPNSETGGMFVTRSSFSEESKQVTEDQDLGFTLVALENTPHLSKIPNLRTIKAISSFFLGTSPQQSEAAYFLHYPQETTYVNPETKEQETKIELFRN